MGFLTGHHGAPHGIFHRIHHGASRGAHCTTINSMRCTVGFTMGCPVIYHEVLDEMPHEVHHVVVLMPWVDS